ncbi:probable methyltransferase PMT27 [Durio zibethinus]|uniref:Probable methyltransferase PMT27 n=1 Tax=Durio zibethinus TaxID=66656 RepID=A0A6P6BE45_DURZI|nr:probable methyltransferase PMT27 [Durio zibethinus]
MGIGGKSRSNKRSSSVSYASTVTTVIFVTLCVFGVWMLTSNSVAPPQTTTTRTATDTNGDNVFSSSNEEQTTKINDDQKDKAVFEDNPGQLPDDAIKPDDGKLEDDKASESDEDKGKEGVAVEENQPDLQGKESAEEHEKQKFSETQISEESVLTQNQQLEQTSPKEFEENKQTRNEEANKINQEENNNLDSGEDQNQSVEQQQGNEKSKEWQKQELDDQQQREDKPKQDVESNEETQETTNGKTKEDDQERSKNDVAELEDEQKRNKQQSQEQQELQMQGIANTTFSDETKDKQKEILNATQTDTFPNLLKTSTNQETIEKDTQSEAQNQETQQQDSPKEENSNDSNSEESLGSSIPKESTESKKSWKTQKTQSENEKERRKDESNGQASIYGYTWQLCNVTAGPDYIPCLDNEKALKTLRSTKHFEHRERHCPEKGPTCLVPLPEGYKRPISWPQSRDKIWYHNVPHTLLAQVKGHQNWVKVSGEFLTFPGGGTQFIHGALHYIDFVQQSVPDIKWGKHTRVVLDVGCGVASFGGFLFDRDVLTMSFAPKDEHEAQVQFALERGIPAISAVMGSQRLPFPSRVFDLVHCARCRVPWHAEGGLLLLELNRVLRPGGYFVWSATPVYQKLPEDMEIWKAMSSLTKSMCWELVTIKKDKLNSIGVAVFRKPTSNECYDKRQDNSPPMCKNSDDANAVWHVPLQACMHRVPVNQAERGARWPANWPDRLQKAPYWLNSSQMGIYGKPAPQDFARDYEHWTRVVSKLYMSGLGISWSNVRNVMDMRAVYGGFAAALKDIKVWVINVVNFDSPDTLPIIYERGLFGIYHDWCESFSTYPRSYDLLHADHLFSKLKTRCKLEPVMAEVDRIVRPGGKLIVRDESNAIGEVENLLKSLHWEVHLTFSKDQEGILSAQKVDWRPTTYQASS